MWVRNHLKKQELASYAFHHVRELRRGVRWPSSGCEFDQSRSALSPGPDTSTKCRLKGDVRFPPTIVFSEMVKLPDPASVVVVFPDRRFNSTPDKGKRGPAVFYARSVGIPPEQLHSARGRFEDEPC